MKSGRHGPSLPNYDRVSAFGSKDLDAFADVGNLRSADEDHFERRILELPFQIAYKFAFADGAVDLASVGVAPDMDIESAKPRLLRILDFFCQENGASTGAEGGLPSNELLQFLESSLAEEFKKGSGLPSGNDETIDLIKLFGLLDEHDLGLQLFEPPAVGIKITLQGQNTDDHSSGSFHLPETRSAQF